MPQLAKGGKHVYGWARVGDTGRIVIPPDALEEYRLGESQALILFPGSRTSGGFGLGSSESVKRSRLGDMAGPLPRHSGFHTPEGEVSEVEGKPRCWVRLRDGGISLPLRTLAKYGLRVGDKLLVVRGSRLAVAFAAKGPIVDEAGKHPELVVYQP
jgi:bifunctional DNA-binding transcriptional regulator/antitoxin component of YhaV-PrlF toxin-antitoxin module